MGRRGNLTACDGVTRINEALLLRVECSPERYERFAARGAVSRHVAIDLVFRWDKILLFELSPRRKAFHLGGFQLSTFSQWLPVIQAAAGTLLAAIIVGAAAIGWRF